MQSILFFPKLAENEKNTRFPSIYALPKQLATYSNPYASTNNTATWLKTFISTFLFIEEIQIKGLFWYLVIFP